MILVIGIDGATWDVIRPNLDTLPFFARAYKDLTSPWKTSTITLDRSLMSPAIWCSMFSGKTPEEHGHTDYIKNEKLVKRAEIPVSFIWDLPELSGKIAAINIPFVVPPYSHGVEYRPAGFGLPMNEEEWDKELIGVTALTNQVLKWGKKPEVVIAVYTLLDRIQHLHWDSPGEVLHYYRQVDTYLNVLMDSTGFLQLPENKLLVVSDHGFCSWGETPVHTLKQTPENTIKGDHHPEAICLSYNLKRNPTSPEDVYRVILEEVG
jgi:predicted AlkP superfamily phosphohydrolase/phosphomutase